MFLQRLSLANSDITGKEVESRNAAEGRSATGYEGPMAPIIASIVGIIVWLVFILVYALYWSKSFDLFQNIIVTIVSLTIATLLIGLMWLIWFKPTGELRRP